jgi:hypothetical protein
MMLLLGMFESTMAFRTRNDLAAAVRLAARVGSNLGNDRLSDWNTILAFLAAVRSLPRLELDYLVVARGDPRAGSAAVFGDACRARAELLAPFTDPPPPGGHGVADPAGVPACNIYTRYQLDRLDAGSTTHFDGTTCSDTTWDHHWCPTRRVDDLTGNLGHGPDVVVLHVRTRYHAYTKLFTSTVTMHDAAVMRIEPRVT